MHLKLIMSYGFVSQANTNLYDLLESEHSFIHKDTRDQLDHIEYSWRAISFYREYSLTRISRIIVSSFYKYRNFWGKNNGLTKYWYKEVKEGPEEKDAVEVHYKVNIEILAIHASFGLRKLDDVSL